MFYVWHNGHRLDNRFVSEEAARTFAYSHCREGEAVEVRDEAGALCWSFEMEMPPPACALSILPAEEHTEDWR